MAFAEKLADDSPDLAVKGTNPDGTSVALRSVLIHMIEEYARRLDTAGALGGRAPAVLV